MLTIEARKKLMSKLVSAMAFTHNPFIFAGKPIDQTNEDALKRIKTGGETMSQKLKQLSTDVLLVVANEHLWNFFIQNVPSICVGIAKETQGPSPRDRMLRVPEYKAQVNEQYAKHVLTDLAKRDFDPSFSKDFGIDHGFVTPLFHVLPKADIPIVPIFVNCLIHPISPPGRFYKLGKALREVIKSGPQDLNVAILGSGQYSIDFGSKVGIPDEEFDQTVAALTSEGDIKGLLEFCTEERMNRAGYSTPEFSSWLTVFGAVSNPKPSIFGCETVRYIGGAGIVTMPFATWEI